MEHEKKVYQKNNTGYYLLLTFIAFNTVYTIFRLRDMTVDYNIGLFIIVTIVLSLISFLATIKIRSYSLLWSYLSGCIGIFQIVRFFLMDNKFQGNLNIFLSVMLVISAVCAVAGGIISMIKTKQRTSFIQHNHINKEYMHS
ncbi:hypothetical protein HZI73_21240 [Vallitalea pronyensis]|uniref:Uncharacterized protein n=1 Tax=Vallitalea pronyensis TaxID=1348613 RepID=A0A8J8MNC3_9FIRM|nr:hypothetical protein [Vallitalea pronyensis]QUI24669.1 hypothetical protein HZI73_21240 [Vallitalea pronyensis]